MLTVLKRVIAIILVFGLVITAAGVSAETDNDLYRYLKSSEAAYMEKIRGMQLGEETAAYVRGSADYTWQVYSEVLEGRKAAYLQQLSFAGTMETEIRNRVLAYYKQLEASSGMDPLIDDVYGRRNQEEDSFRNVVFDIIEKVVSEELLSRQQVLKQSYQAPASRYYWKTLARPEWDAVSKRGNFIRVKKGRKFGLLDMDGKIVLKAEFDKIILLDSASALGQRRKDGRTNEFVDAGGKVVFSLPASYELGEYHNGQAIVSTQSYIDFYGQHFGKAGVIDTRGKFIIPMNYLSMSRTFTEKGEVIYCAQKRVGNEFFTGLVNRNGKVILPFQYSDIQGASDTRYLNGYSVNPVYGIAAQGLIIAARNGKYGCIDINGKVKIPFMYDDIEAFQNGQAIVRKAGKYGVVDCTGKVVVPIRYEEVHPEGKSIYEVVLSHKMGLADSQGKVIAKPEWDSIHSDSDRFTVTKNNKVGCMDSTGRLVIPVIYDKCYDWSGFVFFEGISYFYSRGKYGYITKDGKIISEAQWDTQSYCRNGYITVWKNGKRGVIDRNGNMVLKPEWDYIGGYDGDGFVNVRRGDWSGILDTKGNVILSTGDMKEELLRIGISPYQPMTFQSTFREGLALLMVRGRYYYVDKSGKIPFAGNYTLASPFQDGLALVYDGKTYDPTGTYLGTEVIPGQRWLVHGGYYHIIDKQGNILVSYPKEMLKTTRTAGDILEADLQMATPPQWNARQELAPGLLKHVVYDEKEGAVMLMKK